MNEEQLRLLVRLGGKPVGTIVDFGATTQFRLLDQYLDNPDRPILGQVFEDDLQKNWGYTNRVHPWFANLLSEGRLRRYQANALGIKETSDTQLLEAVGADLPGAVTVERMAEGFDAGEVFEATSLPITTSSGVPGARFSVAGEQLKFSMLNGEKGFTLPGKGQLGRHIVKLPSAAFENVPMNEFAIMEWASASGLDIPQIGTVQASELDLPEDVPVVESTAFTIERFDRPADGSRIHIEDFNQVVSHWPSQKYDNFSYENLSNLVFGITGELEDLFEFVRRLAFNIIVGNEDAHLKNFSLIYNDPRRPRLSPAYDIVSIVLYKDLRRGLGLSLDRSRELASFTVSSFDRIAATNDLQVSEIRRVVAEFVESAMDHSSAALRQLGRRGPQLEKHLSTLELLTNI